MDPVAAHPQRSPTGFLTPHTLRQLHRVTSHARTCAAIYLVALMIMALATSKVNAAEDTLLPSFENVLNCSTYNDSVIGTAHSGFRFTEWIRRGLCVRRGTAEGGAFKTLQCYSRLQNVLENNLNELRKAEYGGAAGVLALLPTIGALLGTPTNEIWRLMAMVPFGGFLVTACSFGGAILPVWPRDYESAFMRRNITGGSHARKTNLPLPSNVAAREQERIKGRADILLQRVQDKLQSDSQTRMSLHYVFVGSIGMLLLLIAAHFAMIVLELGAVLPWWCISKYWLHLWYILVILSAMFENYVQLPFKRQWRLCLSDVPYDVDTSGGDFIDSHTAGQDNAVNNVKAALLQLQSLKAGTVTFRGGRQCYTEPRNVLFALISVVEDGNDWRITMIRSLSKIASITIFVIGTAFLASVQLVASSIAIFVLSCVLGAGVFSRAIASWIVAGLEMADPMVHYVADTEDEAYYVLTRLFTIGAEDTEKHDVRPVQVELHGHVFLDRRRFIARSSWPQRILGVLSSPFDIGSMLHQEDNGTQDAGNPAINVA